MIEKLTRENIELQEQLVKIKQENVELVGELMKRKDYFTLKSERDKLEVEKITL